MIKEGGYRKGVKGRAVRVHVEFETFYRVENNVYKIYSQQGGIFLGEGLTLKGAVSNTLECIKRSGVEPTRWRIKKLMERYGPGKGGKK